MPKASIIVPIFNVERALPRCINSIINQTFTDFELILVDDGSTDNSLKICKEYSKKDARIVVISQNNSGPSAARNAGLNLANGEHVVFIDSDDYIAVDYLEKLLANKSDLTICGVTNVDENGTIISTVDHEEEYCNDLKQLYRLFRRGVFSPCCKLFKKDIIEKNQIRFPENLSWGEDGVFVCRYIAHICDFNYISQNGYYYVKYNSRTTLSTRISNDTMDTIMLFQDLCIESLKCLPESVFERIRVFIKEANKKHCSFYITSLIQSKKIGNREKERLLVSFLKNPIVKETIDEYNNYYPNSWGQALLQETPERIIRTYNAIQRKQLVKKTKRAIRTFFSKLKNEK